MEVLPNELLLEIINQLLLEGVHNIVSISLVNRRLHRLTNELVYTTYSLNRGNPALFIRTLASWSVRERYVREVDWDCKRVNNHALVTNDAFLFPDDMTPTELQNISQGLGFEESLDTNYLNKALMDMGTDAYLSLFLSLTPHVRTIRVAVPSVWTYHTVWFKSALRLPVLSKLSKASIVGPMRIQNVVPLFLLPSLRSLTLDRVEHDRNRIVPGARYRCFEWYEHDEAIRRLRKENSGIESLHIRGCSVDTVGIAQLIRLIRRLETLEFEYGGHDNRENEDFLHAVTHHSNSLTSLSLKDFRFATDPNLLSELGKLERMTTLLLDATLICGSHLIDTAVESLSKFLLQLPRRLQHLRLIANDLDGDELKPSAAFSNALHAIAPTIKDVLPDLHTLEVVDWDPLLGTFTCQTQVKDIQLAFAENGIKFRSQPCDPFAKGNHDDDIVILEGEEEGWMWVQWVDSEGLWIRGRDDVWVHQTCLHGTVVQEPWP